MCIFMIFHTTDKVFILYINSFVIIIIIIIIIIISRKNFCSTIAYARSLMFVSICISVFCLLFHLQTLPPNRRVEKNSIIS